VLEVPAFRLGRGTTAVTQASERRLLLLVAVAEVNRRRVLLRAKMAAVAVDRFRKELLAWAHLGKALTAVWVLAILQLQGLRLAVVALGKLEQTLETSLPAAMAAMASNLQSMARRRFVPVVAVGVAGLPAAKQTL
jgi:hypothetical protein